MTSSNLTGLENFQKKKREETIQKVKNAIKFLQDSGKEINFKSVSRESYVTRKTLYKVTEIKNLIESLREPIYNNDANILKIKQEVIFLEEENRFLKEKNRQLSKLQNDVLNLQDSISSKIA